ncbi:MAG: PepSY domain-containing protein [Gammaproteobacteria bacterium]|nr:PepSY domain-containing protein [Gammaproteobacteria bacterium]
MRRLLIPILLVALLGGGASCAFAGGGDEGRGRDHHGRDGDIGHREARKLVREGVILPLSQIMQRIRETREGRIIEVELEHKGERYTYEVELLDEHGQVWEMKIDAASGQLEKLEQED